LFQALCRPESCLWQRKTWFLIEHMFNLTLSNATHLLPLDGQIQRLNERNLFFWIEGSLSLADYHHRAVSRHQDACAQVVYQARVQTGGDVSPGHQQVVVALLGLGDDLVPY